jgi:hypothetical protein
LILFEIFIAAAKLANATQRNNPSASPDNTKINNTKHKHHHHHHKKHAALRAVGVSIKSATSNGSQVENFSTDDAEELMTPKDPSTPNFDQLVVSDSKALPTSKIRTKLNNLMSF